MSAVPLRTPGPPAPDESHPRSSGSYPTLQPPPLGLVRPVSRGRRLAFVVLLASMGMVAVFATVAINALAAGDAVAALRAERVVEEAEGRYTELVARVARLEDPARIRRVARDELGMIPATEARFLVLERPLPANGDGEESGGGMQRDPLKPVLSVQR